MQWPPPNLAHPPLPPPRLRGNHPHCQRTGGGLHRSSGSACIGPQPSPFADNAGGTALGGLPPRCASVMVARRRVQCKRRVGEREHAASASCPRPAPPAPPRKCNEGDCVSVHRETPKQTACRDLALPPRLAAPARQGFGAARLLAPNIRAPREARAGPQLLGPDNTRCWGSSPAGALGAQSDRLQGVDRGALGRGLGPAAPHRAPWAGRTPALNGGGRARNAGAPGPPGRQATRPLHCSGCTPQPQRRA